MFGVLFGVLLGVVLGVVLKCKNPCKQRRFGRFGGSLGISRKTYRLSRRNIPTFEALLGM